MQHEFRDLRLTGLRHALLERDVGIETLVVGAAFPIRKIVAHAAIEPQRLIDGCAVGKRAASVGREGSEFRARGGTHPKQGAEQGWRFHERGSCQDVHRSAYKL